MIVNRFNKLIPPQLPTPFSIYHSHSFSSISSISNCSNTTVHNHPCPLGNKKNNNRTLLSQTSNSQLSFQYAQKRYYNTSSSSLSTEISDDPIYFHRDSNKDIYIIGTSHVSKKSAEAVRNLIRDVKPDTIVVELCQARYQKLKAESEIKNIETRRPQKSFQSFLMEIMDMIRSGNIDPSLILQKTMQNFYNSFRMLGIIPGLEFKYAIQEAERLNANVVLGDVDISVTMRKLSKALLSEMMVTMTKHSYESQRLNDLLEPLANVLKKDNITEEELDREFKLILNNTKLKEMRSLFQSLFPMTFEAMMEGREQYIAKQIKTSKGRSVVAVVGALHVEGIKGLLNLPADKIPEPLPAPPQNLSIQDALSSFRKLF
ncbi:hypothetical protein CYY_003675 [Polysphondylium violaceum]|uniref:TraB family protein n=1 Tax=Polysphondylium violaceum TaxID=133409 RepID=A0A8J4PVY1_9MYCE|nr:hypothetical protein CYY_003675 [Polysphondylium violaceum]